MLSRRRSRTAFVAVFLASGTVLAHAAGAYLPKTGPVPLRISPPPAPTDPSLLARFTTHGSPANPASSPDDHQLPNLTDASAISTAPERDRSVAIAPGVLPLDSTTFPPGLLPTLGPGSDAFIVTPQMLSEFFSPTINPSNQVPVSPSAIGFTPPMPRMPASSQAIYISK